MKKPIIQTDKSGKKFLRYWPSAQDAAAELGLHPVIISYNVNGHTKQAKGHYFRFATAKEIEAYTDILNNVAEITETNTVELTPDLPNIPVETIPEVIEKPENQDNTLSAFDRLLQQSKKKFNENS